jgi:hypothetical protein
MVSAETNGSPRERALYPLVQDYFEKICKKQCWTEGELRGIQPRDLRGRYEAEGRPIPDLVAVDFSVPEIIAVEIKRDTSPEKLDECIGKLMRMLRFANKVYGAFLHPTARTTDIFKVLRESIPQVGLLEINPEKLETPVVELVAAEHREATVKAEYRELLSLELERAKGIPQRRQFGYSDLILPAKFDPENRCVIVAISALAEERFENAEKADYVTGKDPKGDLCNEIDAAIQVAGYLEEYGDETEIKLISEHLDTCESCHRVKPKGSPCRSCGMEDTSVQSGEDEEDEF